MRMVIGTIGTTLAIVVVVATSAAPAGTQDSAAGPHSAPGRDSHSADLSLALRAHGDLAAVASDAPADL